MLRVLSPCLALLLIALSALACAHSDAAPALFELPPDAGAPTASGPAQAPGSPAGDATAPQTPPLPPPNCPYDGPPVDLSPFMRCLDGGVCVPAPLVPDAQRARLQSCDSGYCVPAKVVANASNWLPTTCASLAGVEGRCQSTVYPDIEKQKGQLPIDVCDPNERCAPCYDPFTGQPTGACNTVSCDAPKKAKVTFADCCKEDDGTARGRCLPKELVGDAAKHLGTKECTTEAEVCVPSETLAPGYIPPACVSHSLFHTYSGVCVSDCVPRDFFEHLGTGKGNCDDGFWCAPCSAGLPGCD